MRLPRAFVDAAKCGTMHPLGFPCTLPAGHHGDHASGDVSWEPSAADLLVTHVSELVAGLRQRGQTTLTRALGPRQDPVLLCLAIDGSAHRLREAVTEYCGWPAPVWGRPS